MYNPIQNGISNSLLPDYFIPFAHRQLRGNNQRAFAMPVFNEFHQGCPTTRIKGLQAEVVKVTEATLTYVATGPDRKPRQLPPLDSLIAHR